MFRTLVIYRGRGLICEKKVNLPSHSPWAHQITAVFQAIYTGKHLCYFCLGIALFKKSIDKEMAMVFFIFQRISSTNKTARRKTNKQCKKPIFWKFISIRLPFHAHLFKSAIYIKHPILLPKLIQMNVAIEKNILRGESRLYFKQNFN